MELSFGDRVRMHRTHKRQTQIEAAGEIKISRGTLVQIEAGRRFNAINVAQCRGIARWMGVSLNTVIGWVDQQMGAADGT